MMVEQATGLYINVRLQETQRMIEECANNGWRVVAMVTAKEQTLVVYQREVSDVRI